MQQHAFHWTSTEVGAIVAFVTTIITLGGAFATQLYFKRVARLEAVAAFTREVTDNATTVRANMNILEMERQQNQFIAIPLVPLSTFSLNQLASPIPKELLLNIEVTSNEGKSVTTDTAKRSGASMFLTSLRSSIDQYNAAIKRHEAFAGNIVALPGVIAGLDDSTTRIRAALVQIARTMMHEDTRSLVDDWLFPDSDKNPSASGPEKPVKKSGEKSSRKS